MLEWLKGSKKEHTEGVSEDNISDLLKSSLLELEEEKDSLGLLKKKTVEELIVHEKLLEQAIKNLKINLGIFQEYMRLKETSNHFELGNLKLGVKCRLTGRGIKVKFGLSSLEKESAFIFEFPKFETLKDSKKKAIMSQIEEEFVNIFKACIDEKKFYQLVKELDDRMTSEIQYKGD